MLTLLYFYVIAVNGAFIMTIGSHSAEATGDKKLSIIFKLGGIVFIVIGVGGMISTTLSSVP